METHQKYLMLKKLLTTLLPKKFPEVDSVEIEENAEYNYGIYIITIYVDGTEYQQEQEIEEYIKNILDHTGETFNYIVGYVIL